MSYLLTEIALEMLGFKFYDIEGKFARTDFQRSTPGIEDYDPLEEPLASHLSVDPMDRRIISLKNVHRMDKSLNLSIPDPELKIQTIQPNELNDLANKTTLPAGFSKLIRLELLKLRDLMACNKNQYVNTNAQYLMQIEQNNGNPFQNYFENQKACLRRELFTLQASRKKIEQELSRKNKATFANYSKHFKDMNQ